MASLGPDDRIWHFDGARATRHHPRLDWTADAFTLHWAEDASGPHRWRDLEPVELTGEEAVYGLRGTPGWRLGFAGAPPESLAALLPPPVRYGRWIDRIGLWRALILFALVAGAILFVALRAPGWIAPHIPYRWEERLGDAMVGDLGGRLCETPASRVALEQLRAQLGDDAHVRQIAIANIDMVNAVALPGGRVLLFNGLLREARSPDEVAGVLAHEIGHVRYRDAMTALVRQLGLSVVLGGFSGQVGGTLNGLLAMRYSRAAERAADAYSIARLRAANISPLPTAAFFERLGKAIGDPRLDRAMDWMASHPISDEREAAFTGSAVQGHEYRPALTPAQWQALIHACRDDPDVKKGFGFFQ